MACKSAGGGTVHAPAGEYFFTGTSGSDIPAGHVEAKVAVELMDGCTLSGDGVGKTILNCQASGGIHPLGSVSNNIGAHDLSTFVGSGSTQDSHKDGIKLIGCNGGTFSNLRVDNDYIGVNFIGCQNIVFTNVLANNCETGFEVDSQSVFWDTDGITFRNCTAANTHGGGLPYGFAVCINDLSEHEPASTYLRNVTLDHCTVADSTNGMYFHQTDHLTVTDCAVSDATWSYYALVCKDYWFAGNTATGPGNNAIPYNAGTSNQRGSL